MLEARIQADFKDGLLPHLQSNARNLEYIPGSEQSRIYVASHSEFSKLHAKDVQRILRHCLILVHVNPIDYDYGWDLERFGRIYDVDKTANVHGEFTITYVNVFALKMRFSCIEISSPSRSRYHHQGTLRGLYEMSTSPSSEEYPPLNAIVLPGHKRNLHIPCQYGSLASHEVAESWIPDEYEIVFDIPNLRQYMEWSLIGTRCSISPLHADSEGLNTEVLVLKGSKYWIVGTEFGKDGIICSFDSLGPSWNPHVVNMPDKAKCFRFEAVHLQKGDML